MARARPVLSTVFVIVLLVVIPFAGCFESVPPPQLPRSSERIPLPPESASGRTGFFKLHLAGTTEAPSKLAEFESVNLVIRSAFLSRGDGKARVEIPLGSGARADLVSAAANGPIVLDTKEIPADTYTGITLSIGLASAYGKDGRPRSLDIAPDGAYYADNRTGLKPFTTLADSTINFDFGLHIVSENGVEFIQTRIDISGVKT